MASISCLFSNAITAKPEVETNSAEAIPRAVTRFGSKVLGDKTDPTVFVGQLGCISSHGAAKQTHQLPEQLGKAASASEP